VLAPGLAVERHVYQGAIAAISLWVIVGLAAQIGDLFTAFWQNRSLTSEERWGWRFAAFWRIAVAFLMVACLLVMPLVSWKVLVLDDPSAWLSLSSSELCQAILLLGLIVAVASAPQLASRPGHHRWSWPTRWLGWITAGVFCVIVLKDHLIVPAIVHMTLAEIELSWPLQVHFENLAASSNPRDIAGLLHIATAGVVAVLFSCVLLRLLSLRWRRGGWQRFCLGALTMAGLAASGAAAARIALADVPRITPMLAASISLPRPHQIVGGVVLVAVLVTAAAYRWSKSALEPCAVGGVTRRRAEDRYYHERRFTAVLLACVVGLNLMLFLIPLALSGPFSANVYAEIGARVHEIVSILATGEGCLSFAVIVLAIQSVYYGRSNSPAAAVPDQPRLSIGLFSLLWFALLIIVLSAVPILAAWGFALCLSPL
jgi:hypothetical protein